MVLNLKFPPMINNGEGEVPHVGLNLRACKLVTERSLCVKECVPRVRLDLVHYGVTETLVLGGCDIGGCCAGGRCEREQEEQRVW